MKLKVFCIIISTIFTVGLFAQTFTVAPAHLVSDYNLSEKLDSQVQQKLQKALTKNGIGSLPHISRFAVVPTVIITNEVVTATVPQFFDVEFELVFNMCDIQTGKVFGSTSIETKTRGSSRENALTKGISSMKYDKDPAFVNFIAQSKKAIFDYYEQNLSVILSKAEQAAMNNDYAQANFIISEIPLEIPSYETMVQPVLFVYAQKAIDMVVEPLLNQAKAAWAANPNSEGAEKVAQILMKAPAGSSFSEEINNLIIKIETDVKSIDQREWNLKVQQLNNEHIERMDQIKAARDVAISWAENQPKVVNKIYLW
ncbi:MAG: hypothetical protein UHE91_07635 [Bacteroidales bacterium]|nr:hypothetical protein [Bacteroidales bacterium]MEE1323682.1 hypothetical protein [Bacteroidales bacterium]